MPNYQEGTSDSEFTEADSQSLLSFSSHSNSYKSGDLLRDSGDVAVTSLKGRQTAWSE